MSSWQVIHFADAFFINIIILFLTVVLKGGCLGKNTLNEKYQLKPY